MLSSNKSLLVAFFSFVVAQTIYVEELSVGNNGKIHSVNGAIEYFHLIGVPNPPEVLSDKIILTPPTPGNSRGALWSDKTLSGIYWSVDVEFRVTGPERAGGNIQIWYVKDGQRTVGTSSIYTVEKFDGLALTIDQYAGSGGSIRGFLNDGTTNYKSHHKVDSLSFSHCDYSYRNLGRPSRFTFSQIDTGLLVTIDGKECFSSNKVKLPPGYSLGITAAGAELPDSIEIFKIVTKVENPVGKTTTSEEHTGGSGSITEQKLADKSTTDNTQSRQEQQLTGDLNTKLQSLMVEVNKLHHDLILLQSIYTKKEEEITNKLIIIESKVDHLELQHIFEVKEDIKHLKEDIHKSLDHHVKNLRGDVRETQDHLINTHVSLYSILSDLGSFSTFAFLTLGGQAILLVGYILYKRRRKHSIKKFL